MENTLLLVLGDGLVNGQNFQKRNNYISLSKADLNLPRSMQCHWATFKEIKPHRIICAAAKVGGINPNYLHPAQFIYENLMIEANFIYQDWRQEVQNLPVLSQHLHVSPALFSANAGRNVAMVSLNRPMSSAALAKLAGCILCESYNR